MDLAAIRADAEALLACHAPLSAVFLADKLVARAPTAPHVLLLARAHLDAHAAPRAAALLRAHQRCATSPHPFVALFAHRRRPFVRPQVAPRAPACGAWR